MIPYKKTFFLSLLVAFIIIGLDQISKYYILTHLSGPLALTSFFNLVIVWNHGVSFGMFSGHRQPLLLIIMALIIVAIMLRWLWQTSCRLTALAIGLVIGGAFGNVIDRIRYGAVADFLDFHWQGYHWPAFNVADSTIFIGVVILCIQSMIKPSEKHVG